MRLHFLWKFNFYFQINESNNILLTTYWTKTVGKSIFKGKLRSIYILHSLLKYILSKSVHSEEWGMNYRGNGNWALLPHGISENTSELIIISNEFIELYEKKIIQFYCFYLLSQPKVNWVTAFHKSVTELDNCFLEAKYFKNLHTRLVQI